jgi:hypothetical protein
MLDFFHQVPDVIALALIVTAMASSAMLASAAGSRLFGPHINEQRDEAAFDAYKALMATAGVVLAFSLIQVGNNLRAAEDQVSREAALIGNADRTLLRFGTPETANLRPLVAAYGKSLVNDEWPALARGERSPTTDSTYTALSKAGRAIKPVDPRQQAMFAELLKVLDDLSDIRELIVEDADTALPNFYWLVTGGFIVISLVLAAGTKPTITRLAGLGSAAAGVGLLLSFVIIVDQPFRGQTSVHPLAIEKVMKVDARRT